MNLWSSLRDMSSRNVRRAGAAVTAVAVGLALTAGCLNRPVVQQDPQTSNVFVDQIRQSDSWTALRERARRHGGHQQYLAQHTAIVDAIAVRDPGAAEQAMRRHIMALQQNLILAAEGVASAAE